jgi:hypothetical protein
MCNIDRPGMPHPRPGPDLAHKKFWTDDFNFKFERKPAPTWSKDSKHSKSLMTTLAAMLSANFAKLILLGPSSSAALAEGLALIVAAACRLQRGQPAHAICPSIQSS